MKKIALILIIFVFLFSNLSLVSSYAPQYTAVDQVDLVIDTTTFTTESGYSVQLATIGCLYAETPSRNLSNYIKNGDLVYLDILNQTRESNSTTFTALVFIELGDYYECINKALLNENDYFFCPDKSYNLTPYNMDQYIPKNLFVNNMKGYDLSNFDNMRTSLMNTYASQTLTHAGYLITIIVASITIFLTILTKINDIRKYFALRFVRYTSIIVFIALICLVFYLSSRLLFWSWMTSSVLGVSPAEAINAIQPTSGSVMWGLQNHLTYSYKHLESVNIGSAFYLLDCDFPFPILQMPWASIIAALPIAFYVSFIMANMISDRPIVHFNKIIILSGSIKRTYALKSTKAFLGEWKGILHETSKMAYFGVVCGLIGFFSILVANLYLHIFNLSQTLVIGTFAALDAVLLAVLLYEITRKKQLE